MEVFAPNGKSTGKFWQANLTGVQFEGADLSEAIFTDAVLDGTKFEKAKVAKARFEKCKIPDAVASYLREQGAAVYSDAQLAEIPKEDVPPPAAPP